jgi:hypothetical protein
MDRTIDVPGCFLSGVAYLDLETRKVDLPRPHYLLQTGEPLSRRWQAFLAGVSSFRRITIVENTGDEMDFLRRVRAAIESDTVVYQATRQFDEMILKGRFTYARRGPEPLPFYPVMPEAEELTWDQKRYATRPERGPDCESKYVPVIWDRGGDQGLVLIHLLRDVVELIIQAGEPDPDCERWCRRVLTDYQFAWDTIFP